ncbi:MAG: Nramp family divalent metal transporter [Planctomycetota bacterium]|jgi:Mn2+/Fe2+ NRAMP family transporter
MSLAALGPGLLVAATGVGTGDLATAGFAGSRLGVAVLWAVVLGAFVKYVLNEGLARWQLATGQTLLEGAITRLGPVVTIVFLVYLLPWSFFVGAALMSACGVTLDAMVPFFEDRQVAKLVFAGAHSGVGVLIAWFGGFKVFERVMTVCIAVMFVTTLVTAGLCGPDLLEVGRGLVVPRIPEASTGGLTWTIALMGGVGGTVTVLCYGYWMREEGRNTVDNLRTCRIDLGVAYFGTALFGIAMMIIANGMTLDSRGADLIVALGAQLESSLGPAGRWVFLVGAWATVFSSLLGVWQAVPYIFADTWATTAARRGTPRPRWVNTKSRIYRGYLLAIAVIPLVHVAQPLREVQKYYAVIGAGFIPILALALLILNGRTAWVGQQFRNRPLTVAILVAALGFSLLAAWFQIRSRWA